MFLLDDAAYPPLNVPKSIADGVWIVDAKPIRAMGVLVLPIRMTIFRLGDGGLLVYSPTHHRDNLQTAIEAFGPIRHLVAPSTGHWMFFRDWQRACQQAKTWAVPELAGRKVVREAGLRFDALLGPEAPPDWAGEIDHVVFRGPGYGELAMHHRASGTLCVTDVMLEVRGETLPPLSRGMAVVAGVCAPIGRAPAQLRALLSLRRDANADAARRLAALQPRRLVPAHGDLVEHGVGEHIRHSLDWLEGDRRAAIGWTLAGIAALSAVAVYAARRGPPNRRRRRRLG